MKNNIKVLRESLGMTLQQMANGMGVSHQRVSQWEHGYCGVETAKKIAAFLNVDVEELGLGTLDKEEIAEKIAWAMDKRGKTINQLAFELKIPRAYLKRWLGGNKPQSKYIKKIASTVGMTEEEFLYGDFHR